jgi:hypothetical protein
MSNGLPSKKSSSAKIITSCIGLFVILLFLCVLCLPILFSTTAGKKMLIKMISNRTGFELEIQELSLSWFGSQRAGGIDAQKPDEQLHLTVQEIETDAPLWRLICMNDIGQMRIAAPNLQIMKPFQPTPPLPQKSVASPPVKPKGGAGKGGISFPLKGKVVVDGGKVEFNSPGLTPIIFDQIALSLDMISKDEIALTLNCTTSPQGQITLKGTASHLKAPFPNISIQSTINQLPVRGIDQFVSILSPECNGLIYSFLGPTINLECNLSMGGGNFDLRFNAISPQLTAYVATQSLNGVLSLKSPAELNFNLTPPLFQTLAKLHPSLFNLSLTKPVFFQTTIEQFSCPIPSKASDLLQASFQAKLAAPAHIDLSLNGKPLSLDNLMIDATHSLEGQFSANLRAETQIQGQAGAIAIESHIDMPFKEGMHGTLSLNAEKFPIGLIGPSSLPDLLGPLVDLHGAIEFTPGNQKLHMNWQSQFLKIPDLNLSLGQSLTLISPSQFTWVLNPKFIADFFSPEEFQLVKADPLQGTIQNLNIPIQTIKNSRLEAILNAGKMSFSGEFPLNVTQLQAVLSINGLDQIGLQIEGTPIKATMAGSYNQTAGVFTLSKPLLAEYTLDKETFKALLPSASPLIKSSVVQLSVDPFSFPLSGFELLKLKIKGQLSTPEIILGNQATQVALQNTILPFQWDGPGQTATVQLSSQAGQTGQVGSLQGQFTLSNLATGSAAIQGSLDLQNLSSTLLDTFSGKCLSGIIGPTFTSKLKLQSMPDKQNLAVKWISPYLNFDMGVVIANNSMQLQGTNNQLTWILTPESYKSLDLLLTNQTQGLIPFEIKESSTFTATLSKLSLPVTAKQKVGSLIDRFPNLDFDLGKLQLSATGRNPKLIFYDKSSHDTIQLSNLTFSLNKSDQNPLAVSMDSTITTQSSNATSSKNGSISLNGKLLQTVTPAGTFDFSQLTGSLQLKAQQLPSRALDIFARAKGRTDFPFTTVFGNMINATLNVDLDRFSGPVTFNVNTPLTRADLNGTIKNGTLTLSDAIHVQMKITPEVSRLVLKEVNPLNLSYLYSAAPVTLEMPAAGFSFPLYPFSLDKITIPQATIELGKITCRNEGNVNIALGLLKLKQFDKSNDLTLWFAPIDLTVKQGIVAIDRTEILLADTFDICTWGKVDLMQDYVDMVLGLTAQTLSKAFGIKNLPENYVLQIPMRGKADNVQIDTKKATAKVALLLAWQQTGAAGAAGALGKGAGGVLGGIMSKVTPLPDFDAKVPPAKHPFPWESQKGKMSHEPNNKRRQFHPNEKPLKQILKLIR